MLKERLGCRNPKEGMETKPREDVGWLPASPYSLTLYLKVYPQLLCLKSQFIPSAAAAAAKSLQSCPTLRDPIDSSPPGSSIPGILQARILEWAAIAFSKYIYRICSSFSAVGQDLYTVCLTYCSASSSVFSVLDCVSLWGSEFCFLCVQQSAELWCYQI